MSEACKSVRGLLQQAQFDAASALCAVVKACAQKAEGSEADGKTIDPSLPHAKFLVDLLQLTLPMEKKTKAADDKTEEDEKPEPERESTLEGFKRLLQELGVD
jgi:hypothetical protein